MSELFLYLSQENLDAPIEWQVRDRRGTAQVESGYLDTAASFAKGRRCVLIISAQHAHITQLELPTQQLAKARQVAPFALEEQLADEVEDLIIELGPAQEQGFPVAAVRRQWLEPRLAQLRAAGIPIAAVHIDAMCLPREPLPGHASLVECEQHWLLRWGEFQARAVPKALGSALLLRDLEGPIQAWGQTPIALPDGTLLRPQPLPEPLLAQLVPGKSALNLLPRETQAPLLGSMWKPWRSAAVLACCAGVLWGAERGLHWYQLSSEVDAVLAQQRQLYLSAYPQARVGADPARQLRAQLRRLERGDDNTGAFLPALSAAADALDQQLQEVYFRNGRAEIVVHAPNYEALEGIKQHIDDSGVVSATLQSATQKDNIVVGKLRLATL